MSEPSAVHRAAAKEIVDRLGGWYEYNQNYQAMIDRVATILARHFPGTQAASEELKRLKRVIDAIANGLLRAAIATPSTTGEKGTG